MRGEVRGRGERRRRRKTKKKLAAAARLLDFVAPWIPPLLRPKSIVISSLRHLSGPMRALDTI